MSTQLSRLLVLGASLAVAGCGAGGGASQVSIAGLFNRDCGACHSITGHGSPHQQGGDLKDLDLPRSDLMQYIGEMPVLHKPLSHAQVRQLADYLQRPSPAASR